MDLEHLSAEQLRPMLREARRRQQIIADFARDALQPTALDRLLHEATIRVAEALDDTRAKVLRYESETADLLMVAGTGWKEGVVGSARLRIDMSSPPGRSLQTGQAVLIEDIRVSEDFRSSPLLDEHGIMALINVPIMVDGAIWGVLEADSTRPGAYSRLDTDLLSALAGVLGAAIQRKGMEASLAAASAKVASLAEDRELLLREMQHRFKNNLQIILSLIAMQQRKVSDPQGRRGLSHVAERVGAISLAQDQLSGEGLGEVKIGPYLKSLCNYIDPGRDNITISTESPSFALPVEQAVPVGLIVNEAVANAIKHAFPDDRPGHVRVTLETDEALTGATLRIADDGVGMGSPRPGGSGRSLTRALSSQISGHLETLEAPDGGVVAQVAFPLRLARRSPNEEPPTLGLNARDFK